MFPWFVPTGTNPALPGLYFVAKVMPFSREFPMDSWGHCAGARWSGQPHHSPPCNSFSHLQHQSPKDKVLHPLLLRSSSPVGLTLLKL